MVQQVRAPTLFDAELALDRLEARLAVELPGHVAALARAYADGSAGPSPIVIGAREVDAVIAARRFDEHRARATRLLRVIAPIVIDSAPAVNAAYARERTWANWRALAAARDAQARSRFGMPHRALVHALAGVSEVAVSERGTAATHADDGVDRVVQKIPASIDGWNRIGGIAMSDEHVRETWGDLDDTCEPRVDLVGRFGTLSILRSRAAHSRTFVVERGACAMIVIPAYVDTLAKRFAVLHELGHARLWLAPVSRLQEWPRAIDEAVASHVARAMETSSRVARHLSMTTEDRGLATAARERRLAIARVLDAIEAGGDTGEIDAVPAALWDDPHAQAAYIEAERLADELSLISDEHLSSDDTFLRRSVIIEHCIERTNAIDTRRW
jgi:hypothetical protein